MNTQNTMIYFTPACNFYLTRSLSNIKISRLKIKKISKEDLLHYFGIRKRVFYKNGNLKGYTTNNKDFSILNEFQKLSLFKCKYAFVSDLNLDDHMHEVENILNALRLLKLNGITCSVTFNNKSHGVSLAYPLFSPIKEKTTLSKPKIIELNKLLTVLANIKSANIELLRLVTAHGRTILSLVFLVIILERTIMSGDKNKNEISFKIRVFGAKALAKYFKFDERKTFEIFKKAYTLRSYFSHGREVSSDKVGEVFSDLYYYTVKILQIDANNSNIFEKDRNNLLFKNHRRRKSAIISQSSKKDCF